MEGKKKIIIASILIGTMATVCSILWISSGSHRVIVGELQATSLDVNGVQYIFVKGGDSLYILPYDENHNPTNVILSPKKGETYHWLCIEITIVEVHMDRFVLGIKARD